MLFFLKKSRISRTTCDRNNSADIAPQNKSQRSIQAIAAASLFSLFFIIQIKTNDIQSCLPLIDYMSDCPFDAFS